jgi:two-component system, chemotaxis family, response regulator Rcp1
MTMPRILVVEDNPIDVKMIKRALKLGGFVGEPDVVNDGAPAIALLNREKQYEDVPLPDLVVLDLNLITVDGEQVLRFIRENPTLNKIRVAILSSTPYDVAGKNTARADCYFVKPSSLPAFEALGKQILDCYSKNNRQ